MSADRTRPHVRNGLAGSLAAGLALACVFVPGQARAQGCGPTRLKTTESVTLNLPPSAVWSLVGDFQNMSWDGDVATATGSGGNSVDKAVRTLTLKHGSTLGESLYKYDAASMSYSYHIDRVDPSRLPVQNASATLEVLPVDGGARSRVVWRSVFYRFLKPGETSPDQADADAAKAMSAYLRSGLDGLKARLDAKTTRLDAKT